MPAPPRDAQRVADGMVHEQNVVGPLPAAVADAVPRVIQHQHIRLRENDIPGLRTQRLRAHVLKRLVLRVFLTGCLLLQQKQPTADGGQTGADVPGITGPAT